MFGVELTPIERCKLCTFGGVIFSTAKLHLMLANSVVGNGK